jgi:GTP-binding protein
MFTDGQRKVVLVGGEGGKGNAKFANSRRRAPHFSQTGEKTEEKKVILELKTIADVGLVGFPNVGKSTILSKITRARPKIANYHFTTLSPNLGVADYYDNQFVVADIPGLIEGASEGLGLGTEFLRHIERTRMLVHVVDVSGSESRDPFTDFETINAELVKYNEELANYPQIVAGNKTDLATDEQREAFKKYIEDKGYEYFEICAPILEGTQDLINAIAKKLATLPPIRIYEREEITVNDIYKTAKRDFKIRVEGDVYIIEAEWLAKILSKTDLEDYESLQYFQNVLQSSGIINALIERGIQEGDTVSIYDLEFDYVP